MITSWQTCHVCCKTHRFPVGRSFFLPLIKVRLADLICPCVLHHLSTHHASRTTTISFLFSSVSLSCSLPPLLIPVSLRLFLLSFCLSSKTALHYLLPILVTSPVPRGLDHPYKKNVHLQQSTTPCAAQHFLDTSPLTSQLQHTARVQWLPRTPHLCFLHRSSLTLRGNVANPTHVNPRLLRTS